MKAVSELYSPVAGEVVEVNAPLADKPETINQDPHGAAWMIVLKLADPAAPRRPAGRRRLRGARRERGQVEETPVVPA